MTKKVMPTNMGMCMFVCLIGRPLNTNVLEEWIGRIFFENRKMIPMVGDGGAFTGNRAFSKIAPTVDDCVEMYDPNGWVCFSGLCYLTCCY